MKLKPWFKWFAGAALIIVLGIYASWELFVPGLLTGHDSESHIVRQIAFEEALKDGQFPVMWAQRPFQGLGSPVLMLNYQLPYILGQFWRILGFSLYQSLHFTLISTFVISGLVAFAAFASVFGWLAGLVGAVVYLFVPYRFVDIYVRAALGEAVSFLFPPLILLALEKNKKAGGALAWAGMFLTHPVGSALCSAFFLGYAAVRSWQHASWKTLQWFVLTFCVGLLLASWNLFPTLFLTKYTHYSPENSHPLKHFPSWEQLVVPFWGYGYSTEDYRDEMPYQVGVAQWFVIGSVAVVIGSAAVAFGVRKQTVFWKRESLFWPGLYALGLTVTAIFFLTPVSLPFWEPLRLTKIIDFPWRILMAVVFGSAFLSAWLMSQRQIFGWSRPIIALGMMLLTVYGTRNYHYVNAHWPWGEEHYYTNGPDGDAYGEYASKYRYSRSSVRLPSRVEIVEGDAVVSQVHSKSHEIGFEVHSGSQGKVRINTMYFPGWKVHVHDHSHDPRTSSLCSITPPIPQEPDVSGLIICRFEPGTTTFVARYEAPPVQKLGLGVSLVGIGVLLWWSFPSFFPPLTKLARLAAFFGRWKKSSTRLLSRVK